MVNEREIISPSILYHHHHFAFIFFSSIFSLIPINFPNSHSLLTLVPFSNSDFPFPLPFSLSFFDRFFPCFLFPIFCSFSSSSIWVSLVWLLGLWVGPFVRGVAVSSPGVLK